MERDTVVRLARPGSSIGDDPLLLVLRDGARRMLQQVIESEVETFLAAPAENEDEHGRRRVVRNGHAPEREIQTGIGPISVRRPKVGRPKLRDRGDGASSARIRFTSKVLPPFLRRTKNVEELLPPPRPAGRVPFGNRMKGLLAFHGQLGRAQGPGGAPGD